MTSIGATPSAITSRAEVTHHAGVIIVTRPRRVASDRDGDGIPDDDDPFPDDPMRCGDTDADTCDDCSVAGASDPANDGPDADGDGTCDAGEGGGLDGGAGAPPPRASGCGCRAASRSPALAWWAVALAAALLRRRRR